MRFYALFQAKQSGCSLGSGGGSTESEGPVCVSVNRHDLMLYVHDVYTMLEPRTLVMVVVPWNLAVVILLFLK